MVKTRAANGKFQTQIQKVESCNDISEIFVLPDNSKKWFFRIMVYNHNIDNFPMDFHNDEKK